MFASTHKNGYFLIVTRRTVHISNFHYRNYSAGYILWSENVLANVKTVRVVML